MNFCAIIPDRGDRKELTDFCFKQLERMTLKPFMIFHINNAPTSESFDLVERIKRGVDMATAENIDWCFIIENDDGYPSDYFGRFLPYLNDYDFIGDDHTVYYNIKTLRWSLFNHPYRSSLFTTAFRISSLNNFEWPDNTSPFLDTNLWKYAKHKRKKFIDSGAVGIKHGIGLCGGKGHKMKLASSDPGMNFLKGKLLDYHIEFYKQFRREAVFV